VTIIWSSRLMLIMVTMEKLEKSLYRREEFEIMDDVKSNKGTRFLLVGESGIGKIALLDEIYRILGDEEKR
jgi:ABC-type dipeptide/oligopeptide/nickel transport system ATPase subunit